LTAGLAVRARIFTKSARCAGARRPDRDPRMERQEQRGGAGLSGGLPLSLARAFRRLRARLAQFLDSQSGVGAIALAAVIPRGLIARPDGWSGARRPSQPALPVPEVQTSERTDDPLLRSVTRVDRLIFRSPLLAMATFRCGPDDPLFTNSGTTQNAIFVFPRRVIRIQHEGQPAFVAGPNLVTFYNPGQVYRRSRVGSDGDESDWYWIEPETLRQVLARYDPAAADSPDRPFRFAWGPSDPRTYLEQRRAFVHAATAECPDRLYLEETMVWILDRVVAGAVQGPATRQRPNARAARRHADLSEGAKALLATRACEPLDLSELARELGCSAFHLCHVFRRQTGSTLSEYQHQMRLRQSLDGVADRSVRLTDLALELGYASHSHFTLCFRRAFGVTPSALRSRLLGLPFRLEPGGSTEPS
jgi:AraC family transcriptional regulator